MAKQNKGRKFFAASATAALVASAIVPVASAAQVNDYNKISGYAKEAVQSLVDAGVIQGDTNGNFNPLNTVTRAQAAEIFTKALELEADGDVNFSDVKKGAWYYNSIAAVVANGIFEGVSANEFAPNKSLTRSEAAKVLVDAFGLEGSESLSQFADASQVKPWAKTALETAVANGIFTGSEENGKLNLKPNAAITRQDFAVVFARTLDLVDTETPVDAAIKAINNTTVEVTFDEEVENVQALDFKIDGLEIKNASVKQSNKKVVVLTTAAQEAGKDYTVTLDGEKLGSFKGIAAVIPTKVELVSTAVQGKLGQEVKVQAKVTVADGQSKAGIPVTFNVPGDNDAVKPTLVGEAVTNEEGIATYSYTRYKDTTDEVTAYATGDRSKFSLGYVFWGVDTILSVEEVTTGASVNNGANKTYKVTYKNPKTGKPEANKTFNVGFVENMNVTSDKVANATVNGVKALQLSNGTALDAAQITTDSKGEATFTVSGTNAAVTPVVYDLHSTNNSTSNKKYSASALQTTASKVTFAALQAEYTIELTRADNAGEVAAIGATNGREYKVVVKDKAGNLAKNEIVNVAFNEDKDRVISTVTNAKFVDTDPDTAVYFTGDKAKQISVKTNDKGEATFVIGSDTVNDYATPIAWIDINTSDAKQGDLDEGEPKAVAPISYFQAPYLDGSAIKAYKKSDLNKAVTKFDGSETAVFAAELVNQSGKKVTGTSIKKATYTVYNTGANDIKVDNQVISPNRSYTVTYEATLSSTGTVITPAKNLEVTSVDGKTTAVKVIATGIAVNTDGKDYAFTAKEATATFTATNEVPNSYTGVATQFNTADSGSNSNSIWFAGKNPVKYAGVSGKTYKYFGANGNEVFGEAAWEALLTQYATEGQKVTISYNVDGDTVTFKVISAVNSLTEAIKPVAPTTPAAPTTGALTLTPAAGGLVDLTTATNTLGISLADADLNVSATTVDTATVSLKDSANNSLSLTLVETGANTGVFATTVQAGTLSSLTAGTLTVTYADAKNAAGVAENITASVTLKKTTGAITSGTFTQGVLPSAATAAEYTSKSIAADYTFATGEGFTLDIDNAGAQVINLAGKKGAQGVADAINAAFAGTATVSGDKVVIKSTTQGAASEVEVSATTATQVLNATVNGNAQVTAGTAATKEFTITTALSVGEKVVIDGVEYTAVAFGTAPTANTFVVESAANTLDSAANQAANLADTITTLNTVDKFTASAAGAVITLTSTVTPVGTTITEPVITLK
ncbi:S-layer homology domain-containing protein [Lysinibacillus capsici]|uniref:S-layer homology domain-containing protein n=1 Tax=Lysinibacillus capsici TaxID=2115968 RepID=UPI00382A46E8